MKNTFRASMALVHTTLGLITGWVLFAIALSGALSVFRQDINLWARPELPVTAPDPMVVNAHALDWLSHNAPTASAWYVASATALQPFATALWPDAKGNYIQRVLDPITGSPDGIRDTLGGEFFYRFHFELQLPYPLGRLIAALAALALVVGLMTGVISHRRIFADFFTFRPSRGQRSWLDMHNLLGVAALPFHLMISFTGAVTLGTLLLPWSTQALYRNDLTASYTELNPALYSRPATGHPAHLAPFLPMLREAESKFGGAGLEQIYVFNPSDQASLVTMIAGNDHTISTSSQIITFDGPSGRVLKQHIEHRPVLKAYTCLYGLHVARFAPSVTRWLYFLSGLALAALIGSGMHLWTIKRLRRPHHRGHRIVARLNVGMLAGTPLAFASFFIANRLIGPTTPHRAGYEVTTLFVVWGLTLLYALARPPERAWPELLGGSAVACLVVSLLSLPWHTSVLAGVSVTSALLSASFAFAAFRTLQKTALPA
ncbi:PepSY-associated TM helix domain-containing protein [Gluconobacter kondonii]|uniref:PepSY-associated TM helix domain-containing protein n=1 Tax=Gluconobacter kondonii TaxID=941463 RepID=UPI001B8C43E8|nr:PepSY-associated TM helix domain-containing protein [Gluconobacter kondonii]MBS1066239.1 PepSY domain-containing protein [Gluconobacter kondonii]MBS1081105.1 PepSY domain-containing protein [Gluconobacter kondonii]